MSVKLLPSGSGFARLTEAVTSEYGQLIELVRQVVSDKLRLAFNVPWVRAVLGVDRKRERSVAYLVARKIARKGTQAQRPMGEAAVATESQVLRMFEDAAGRVAAHLAGGAA